jgi:hypothetical protein
MAVAQARSFASNEPGKGAALIFTESGDSLQTVSELSLGHVDKEDSQVA